MSKPKAATKPTGKLDFAGLNSFSALLSSAPEANAAGMREIPVDQIAPDPDQPRKNFDATALAELAESIRVHGVIEPVVLRTSADGFQLIAGERRWRAAKQIGLAAVPAIIRDDLSARAQMVENLQRADLSAFEIYRVVAAELDAGATQKELATAYGKGKSWISEFASVSKMPTELQDALREGRAGDIYALSELNRLHKHSPEEVEKLAASGAPITRHLVNQLAEKLARAVTGDGKSGGDGGVDAGGGASPAKSKKEPTAPGKGVADNGEGLDVGGRGPASVPGAPGDGNSKGDDYQPPKPQPNDLPVSIRVRYDGEEYTVRYAKQQVRDGIQQVMLAADGGITLYAPLAELQLVSISAA